MKKKVSLACGIVLVLCGGASILGSIAFNIFSDIFSSAIYLPIIGIAVGTPMIYFGRKLGNKALDIEEDEDDEKNFWNF